MDRLRRPPQRRHPPNRKNRMPVRFRGETRTGIRGVCGLGRVGVGRVGGDAPGRKRGSRKGSGRSYGPPFPGGRPAGPGVAAALPALSGEKTGIDRKQPESTGIDRNGPPREPGAPDRGKSRLGGREKFWTQRVFPGVVRSVNSG